MNSTLKICSRCIMDTTVPDITFDENGVCNYCKLHDRLEKKFPATAERDRMLAEMVQEIKSRGAGRKYDCVVGVSGGCDSTYLLYWAKKAGLRPLAVHLDNGWNSEIAEENMRKVVDKMEVELKAITVDEKEFLDLQKAFLKASVPDIEIPTDIGIYSTLFKVAAEEKIPSVLNGHSFRNEGSVPMGWTYMDGRYLEDVYRRHGSGKRLEHYNNLKIATVLKYSMVKRIREYRPLELLEYTKKGAGEILSKEVGWRDYGGHHYESVYTRFVASYILVSKFKIDKRKVTFSAMVRSGMMTREEALQKIKTIPYPPDKVNEDKDAVLARLGLAESEWEEIMKAPIRSFKDYKSYYSILHRLRFLVKIASKMGIVSEMVYEKYC
ncbi:MAG: N-acetyl sugar amidotransferase [Candidatus Thermoplasmatota archaeon]|nr:N-acetyl sugar amidotransferase [Candidatus Thermoplasmatota archaeon]